MTSSMQPYPTLDLDLLDLIEAHFLIGPVIKSHRERRLVAGNLLRELQRDFIHQIASDTRRANEWEAIFSLTQEATSSPFASASSSRPAPFPSPPVLEPYIISIS